MTNLQTYCKRVFPNVKRVKALIKDVDGFKNYEIARAADRGDEYRAARLFAFFIYLAFTYLSSINN